MYLFLHWAENVVKHLKPNSNLKIYIITNTLTFKHIYDCYVLRQVTSIMLYM